MISRRLIIVAAFGLCGSIWILFDSALPLGIPGEWDWPRIELDSNNVVELLTNLALAIPYILIWLGLVAWCFSRIDRWNSARRATALYLLLFASFMLSAAMQSLPPTPWPQMKGWVLYYPHSSGYFHKARYEIDDTGEFLAGYEDLMAQGDVGHLGTHPPGLFLFHRGLYSLCAASPDLSQSIDETIPENIALAFDQIDENLAAAGERLSHADRAALWLAIGLTQFIGIAALIPLYLILSRFVSPSVAFAAAALWPLIPALSIFLPKSDALYPTLGVLFVWLWISAHEKQTLLRSAFAGVVFWIGCCLSLAIVPWGLIAGLFSIQRFFAVESSRRKPILLTSLIAVGAFLLLTLLAGLWGDVNLFNVWLWNYVNHANFYSPENYPRSWIGWLLVNPLETALAVGLPLFVLALSGFGKLRNQQKEFRELLVSCLAVWGLIWLSGKNSGEAARLWLVFFPIVCLFAGASLSGRTEKPDTSTADVATKLQPVGLGPLLCLLILQLTICAITAVSVSGFHPAGSVKRIDATDSNYIVKPPPLAVRIDKALPFPA